MLHCMLELRNSEYIKNSTKSLKDNPMEELAVNR